MIWLILAGGILLLIGLYKPKKENENEIKITIEDSSSGKISIRRSDEEATEGRRVGVQGGGYGPSRGWGRM